MNNLFARELQSMNNQVTDLLERMNALQKYSDLQFSKEPCDQETFDQVLNEGNKLVDFRRDDSTWEYAYYTIYKFNGEFYLRKKNSYKPFSNGMRDLPDNIYKVIAVELQTL
jgi:hypothetical protein